jgi:hypothetical protein
LLCLWALLWAGNAISSTGFWLSTNIAIAGTSERYSSDLRLINQESNNQESNTGTTGSIAGGSQNAPYTLDPGFAIGLRYEGAINALPNLNLTHVPKLAFSQAVIHFPSGFGAFLSPTTIASQSFIISEQLNWNVMALSSPTGLAVGVGYRHTFNYDTFRLGNWTFVEKPNWGAMFYQVEAYWRLHNLIANNNNLQLILNIEKSDGLTFPHLRIEADF